MVTKQAFFLMKLKELGGTATTRQMMDKLDMHNININELANNLERRGLVKVKRKAITGIKCGTMNVYVVTKRGNSKIIT